MHERICNMAIHLFLWNEFRVIHIMLYLKLLWRFEIEIDMCMVVLLYMMDTVETELVCVCSKMSLERF